MTAGAAVATCAGALAGAMLLAAGVAKLADRRAVAPLLAALGLPRALVEPVRRLLPFAEIGAGGWLLSARALPQAATAAVALSFVFAATLLLARLRGVDQPCRCFGAIDRAGSRGVALARAAFLLAAAAVCLGGATAAASGDATAGVWSPEWGLGVLLALGAVLGFALAGEVATFRAGVRRLRAARPPSAL
jgi:hypothetical protein